ncbi:MAG: hypothetical protein N2689_01235 [Verrucomicrobiae bacterium]|nr:hypothetical protein [Verrucomicrobiae bacterium]
MNPFRSETPWDYEYGFYWTLGFLVFVVLSAALMIWVRRRQGPARNRYVYWSLTMTLLALVPVEQLLGPWLSPSRAYQLSLLTHRARYVLGGLGVLFALMAFARIYWPRRHRPVGGQLGGALGLVLGGLVCFFNNTQQLWPVERPPEMREPPNVPMARGGYVVTRPNLGFGFVVPSRDWSEEPALVRAAGAVAELTQRTLRARTRVFAESGKTSLLRARDRCVADLHAINPEVVIEREEKLTVNNMEAVRITARGMREKSETRFFCTVYLAGDATYRIISWAPAAVYPQVRDDIEYLHGSVQLLTRKQK